jgi:hypothetical protein
MRSCRKAKGGTSVTQWSPEIEINLRGEPTAGLVVFALRPASRLRQRELSGTLTAFGCESRPGHVLHGETWEGVVWDLPVREWPTSAEDFYDQLGALLERVVASGRFGLAWIAQDFVEPPELFEPSSMSGRVYGAFSRQTGLLHGPATARGLAPLTDAEMLALRSIDAIAYCFSASPSGAECRVSSNDGDADKFNF